MITETTDGKYPTRYTIIPEIEIYNAHIWINVKVPMDWDESEIRNSMMKDSEISEIYNMFETGCSDDNYQV